MGDSSLRQRFERLVEVTPGCWTWKGSKSPNGYGKIFNINGPKNAHRVSYELYKGPIPAGYQIDHLCRNRGCVNPEHLEAVTQRTNILRGEGVSAKHALKERCPSGHPYSIENTIIKLGPGRRTYRRCRTCEKSHKAAWYVRQNRARTVLAKLRGEGEK